MHRAKEELRRSLLRVRDAIPADLARAAADAATRHLLALPALAAPRAVALYAPVRRELDPELVARALLARGVPLAYPRVLVAERRLAFHRVADPERELQPGAFGIREPAAGLPVAPVDEIDVFVVPGLAFDRIGTRLGWGRGYYDRTLAAHHAATRIGFCYACQILDQVPRAPEDLPMRWIVTEDGVWSCGGAGDAPGGVADGG